MSHFLRQPSYVPSLDRRLSALSPAATLPRDILRRLETNITLVHRKATEREVRKWDAWCDAYERCCLPVHDPDLLVYLNERHLFGASLRTLRGILTAINSYQLSNGMPRTESGLIRSYLRALGKTETITRATPCMPADVARMCDLARLHGGLRALRDVAILQYLWASAERSGEVTRTDIADLRQRRRGALVHIPWSKTDQMGRGQYIMIKREYDRDKCALHSLERWAAFAGISEGPVFRRLSRTGKVGAPLKSLYYIVKPYLLAIDLPGKCTTYSFRRGWATDAYMNNRSLDEIREHLRHEDAKTTRTYIEGSPRMSVALMPYRRMIS